MKDKKDLSLHQLYNVRNTSDQVWVPNGPLAWSTTNIIVFASTTSHRKSYFLHFLHADTPWEVSVNPTPHMAAISIINFDGKGVLLYAIDTQSKITIWSMHGSIINDWQLIKITDTADSSFYTIDTQPVIRSSWTNIGQNYARKTWNVKNEDVQSYWTAKFSKGGPSTLLKSKTLDVSVINVTARGLVCLITPGKKVKTAYLPIKNMLCADVLVPWKNYVDIATVDVMCTLRLYAVEIEAATLKYSLSRLVELGSHLERNILDIKFDNPYTSDSDFFVLVQDLKEDTGHVEKWHLTQGTVPINPVLRGQPAEPMSKMFWERKHTHKLGSLPNNLKVPILPYSCNPNSDGNKIGLAVVVGCEDGLLYTLSRSDLNLHETKPLPTSAEFKPKRGVKNMHHFTLSPAACCLATVSEGILSVFSFRNVDIDTETEVVWLSSVLEHCILNGWNHWEIMSVAIRREDTLQRLEFTLNRSFDFQNPEIRQLYLSRLMSIKMTLYKLQTQTSHWPCQMWSCMFLNCLTDKFKSLLPVDVVNNHLVIPQDSDLNGMINMVDTKQFSLPEHLLLAQQPLFQWVLDYSQLISICVLPQKRTSSTSNWQSVVTDSRTLSNLRDMLALMKIWSTITPRCSPVLFNGSENNDFSGIFKTLSMLVKQFPHKNDVPNSDYDKIQLFQQKLTVIPSVHMSALVHASSTQEYEFQCEPNILKCAKILNDRPVLPLSKVNSVINNADRDMLRNMVLSAHSLHLKQEYIKQCVICGCVTTLNPPTTQLQWWMKWKNTCICGGNWKKCTVLA